MMTQAILPLALCVSVETAEQMAYGLAGIQRHQRRRWIALGISLHLLLLALWCWLLTLLPLGVAVPLAGASYLTIALASWVILRERVNRRCWIGIVTIVVGVALITSR